jgi:hypothetical protein
MNASRKEAVEELIGLLSLVALFVGGIAFTGIGLANYALPSLGIDMEAKILGWEIVGFLFIASALLVFVAYLSFVAWLLISRSFLSSNAIWRVVRMGPSTKFDRWLVKAVVGESDAVQS